MLICGGCGEANPDRFRFCGSCAARLAPAGAPVGSRRIVSVVFCDVVGSTNLGERLDAETLRLGMARYFEAMKDVLERHGATVEKFIGDAVMAVFGVPQVREDDAHRAVCAAVEMRRAVVELNLELEHHWGLKMDVRIGINTGEVIADSIPRRDSFVAGDAVNTGARLQQAAGPGEILIGASTYKLVRDSVRAEPMPPVTAKGKSSPLPVFRLEEMEVSRPAPVRRHDHGFIGRVEQLAMLRSNLDSAIHDGSFRLVSVIGEAGVGKSRLVQEFIASVAEEATVLQGGCVSYGERVTYKPIARIIKQAAGITDADGPGAVADKLQAAMKDAPEKELVAQRLGTLVGLDDGRPFALAETFWATRRLLEAVASDRPLVVVVEDIHWAELPLLDLIEYIIDHARSGPVLIVCLARPELIDRRAGWGSGPRALAMALAPLTVDECESLIRSRLGSPSVPADVAARLTAVADGNPLFLEELLSMILEDGLIERLGNEWKATGDLAALATPLSIQTLLASRLEQLPAGEREVLQRAAVIGRFFYWSALAHLSPEETRPDIGSHLASLVRRELIRPEASDLSHEDAFVFRHSLIAEAAYRGAPKLLRAELHEGFGEWLSSAARERVAEYEELIGFHLETAAGYRAELSAFDERQSILAARAADCLSSAGRRALARGDMTSATNLLQRAVALLDEDKGARAALMTDLGVALVVNGKFGEADEMLTSAAEAAEAAGDRLLEARAAVERAFVSVEIEPQMSVERALHGVADSFEFLEAVADHRGLARGWQLIATDYWTRCMATKATDAYERALSHARKAGDRRAEWESLGPLAYAAYWGPLHVDDGLRRCDDIEQRADGDPVIAAVLLIVRARFFAISGDFDQARDLARRAEAMMSDLGIETDRAMIAALMGDIALLSGDPATAERELRLGFEAIDRMGESGQVALMAALLARALYALGRNEEAYRLTQTSEAATAPDDTASSVLWRATRAKALARRGEFDAAISLARDAVAIAGRTDFTNDRADTLMDYAAVLDLSGRSSAAARAVRGAIRLYEKKGNLVGARHAQDRLEATSAPGNYSVAAGAPKAVTR